MQSLTYAVLYRVRTPNQMVSFLQFIHCWADLYVPFLGHDISYDESILCLNDFKIQPLYQSQIGHSNFVAYLQFYHVPTEVPQKSLWPILTFHMWI